ncbi:carboxypeptidase M32 [Ketogulonicigenium vulgare]|uniref:Metal-dependent carboxypeptidase n=1 Tax=Ketogulonicigenium vulgare (strain WSH-001) TaxID=759362 RepID=F9Y6Y6_KETVW|nr:carboxypeptidase M32 [Ketogulonicigenium vulgare]ADO42818.1 thermostable carboxypeptidase [Ketogulonicigenium vulgare Y25]AEM41003.1 Carboxypeptidase Taq (M32) metallopeptidase superfamily protein [Ketogulonicigenium vulgare WSH-001]ALJ81154.1 peptidase M32 [Ketogulonicigenium vulgare]ANW33902.1 peptidase M32 [Ketogulonicigenium vulgare]AOZ54730.1 thermostable carboxypeptidase [Ketogulonicigenium vulgare]
MMSYDALLTYLRTTEALGQVAGRLGWDQETVMPEGAADQRAEEIAALEEVIHARRTAPAFADLLAGANPVDDVQRAMVARAQRGFDRSSRIPAELAAEAARVNAISQHRWIAARKAGDLAGFLPTLQQVVALQVAQAQALADGGDAYDALLDGYEPGMSAARLTAIFSALRPGLVDLRAAIAEKPPAPHLNGHFDEAQQMALSQELALAFGYDLSRGRIDKAVHPFSSGSGADVRITTRTDAADPFNCFYSTIHEVGHATYEQNIRADFALTPLGEGVSMGVHESQSRIYENQLARSPAFAGWLFGQMRDMFGDFGISDAGTFARAVNRVAPGFIRTEADEVHYNLHIMMRFDLERALIAGDLAVADLEEAWNTRFAADFGLTVPNPVMGVLQDVHWPAGLFGYFPTYALGNIYAGCLHQALRADLPDLDDALAAGNPAPALDWLRGKVQQHGGLYAPADLITRAAGFAPTEAPLLAYLQQKFGALYGI